MAFTWGQCHWKYSRYISSITVKNYSFKSTLTSPKANELNIEKSLKFVKDCLLEPHLIGDVSALLLINLTAYPTLMAKLGRFGFVSAEWTILDHFYPKSEIHIFTNNSPASVHIYSVTQLTHCVCGTIWQHRTGSVLAQVMTPCLTTPNHYLNQCELIISKILWH